MHPLEKIKKEGFINNGFDIFENYAEPKSNVCDDLVTLIVSVYNKEKYIEKMIYSIMNQNYKNIEVIFVNDNSNDNSLEELIRLKKDNFKVYSSCQNYGTYACRNFAIKNSKGDFITFLDADDEIHFNHINNLVSIVKDGNKLAAMSLYKRYNEIDKTYSRPRICEASLMVRRSIFKELGFFELVRCGADTEFRERICASYGKDKIGLSLHCSYIANFSKESLTSDEKIGWKSDPRVDYVKKFRSWHKNNPKLFVNYNSLDRYSLDESIIVKGFEEKNIKKIC